HPVLRAGKALSDCIFENDDAVTTVHLGLYHNNVLAAVASIFDQQNPAFKGQKQYQLRGMAVLPEFQNRHFGRKLLDKVEQSISGCNAVLWFNARASAVPFYQKSGFVTVGEPFEVNDIGTHYVMYKEIA
nr:GNAT family N-acetyltransferase [Flavobacterium sp.]